MSRKIADKYKVSVSTLHEFLTMPEHSARATAALRLSSGQYAYKAEEVLINAEGLPHEIQRARELAQHYRWMASKRSPKEYGDKIEVEQTVKHVEQPSWLSDNIPSTDERPDQ